jgi:hypothetical protein
MRDIEVLEAALIGFQHLRDQVDEKIAALRSQIGASPARVKLTHLAVNGSTPKKRTMSASARKRIALAQKKRWATYKAEHGAPVKAKRVLSAAGRARIIAATKKRWAAFRKAQ